MAVVETVGVSGVDSCRVVSVMGEEDVAKVEATKPLEVGGSVFPESRREAGEVEGEAIVGVTG